MRKKHLTSHIKLPTLIIFLLFSHTILAKTETKDTNIICFAAQSKWICAPEDQQEIASEKANKILESNISNQLGPDVVIKSIYMPKFDSSETRTTQTNDNSTLNDSQSPTIDKPADKPTTKQSKTKQSSNNHITSANTGNPYAKLWSHQLIGLSTPQSAINFVYKKKLNKDEVIIIKSVRNNTDWWIVLYGLYKDKQTGLDNEFNLPTSIDKPWLRPLKNLQVNGFIEKY